MSCSCGKEIPGCKTKLHNPDEEGNGEICFWGRHVFMGYLNMPDKTEEALDAEGWLHSGDLGKHDENGFLFITGRIKGRFKNQDSRLKADLEISRSGTSVCFSSFARIVSYLTGLGSISELIITAGGENIPPVPIEDAVKEAVPLISNAMLIGDKRKFLSMLLTIKVHVSLDKLVSESR